LLRTENNILIILYMRIRPLLITAFHPRNNLASKLSPNHHSNPPHHTSAQPHDATTDPVNSIPEDPPVTLYLKETHGNQQQACAGKLKKKVPDQDATVRSEPRYSCVSDPWGSTGEDPSCHADAGILASYLSCFRQGKSSANVRSLNWWCDVYGVRLRLAHIY
jgi:hypothetical protein